MSRILTLSAVSLVLAGAAAAQGTGGAPPDAEPGACYAQVRMPETYEVRTEQVLDQPEHTRARVIPATYETVVQRVLVKEQAVTYRVVPPVYEIETEQLLIVPEQTETVVIPAEYETITERVMIRPAYITWKPAAGLSGLPQTGEGAEPPATADGLRRVEVPAQYDTVSRTRLKSPERVETHVTPARIRTVERQVLREPARVVEEIIPAEYEDIEVQRLVAPEQQETVVVPATYKTIETRTLTGGGTVEWRQVLCDSDATEAKIAEVQRALAAKSYNVEADGVSGPATQNALQDWQEKNGLPAGYLTIGTLESLGVSPE
nr:peptidoglycan-binding domain-containing protein [uncultured Hyphomonas sp.]